MSAGPAPGVAAGAAPAPLTAAALSALLRPRILVLVAAETAAGYLLADPSGLGPLPALLAGTVLVAAAGCALNHWLERDTDARMERTAGRPLVTGALSPRQVAVGGASALAAGLAVLALACGPLVAGLQALAAALYLGVYTPLKRRTSTNTWIGAIPGAMPVLAGAAAASGGLPLLLLIVFLLIVLWQLPHFFAIASMYREQYACGGLRMVSGDDPHDEALRWQIPLQVMSVVLVSVLPVALALAGPLYGVAALALGAAFLAVAWAFRAGPGARRARAVVLASVAYLPLLLAALVLDVARGDGRAALAGTACAECGARVPGGLPVLGHVPDFTLRDQDGGELTRADLAGAPWIADFIFTRCAGQCVPMAEGFAELARRGVAARLVSVSIDPEHDDPERLAAWRARWGAAGAGWTVAGGTAEQVEALAAGFRLPAAARRGATPPVEGTPELFHSGKYALVDGDGHVRGYYDHDDRLQRERLLEDAAALAARAPDAR